MQSTKNQTSNFWNNITSAVIVRWILTLGQQLYDIWFYINTYLVKTIQKNISPALGAIFGMVFLEGHTMCKAIWYTFKKYRNDPKFYGFNQWDEEYSCHRPVLLLHGAVGSWSYLGDLAIALKNANIPVFVIDLGFGLPREEMREKIFNKIAEIRKLYSDSNKKSADNSKADQNKINTFVIIHKRAPKLRLRRITEESDIGSFEKNLNTIPLIDIIAHSDGGNLALYSAFTQDCSYIDGDGNLKFRTVPQANPFIGKIITIALPSNHTETNSIRDINKINDLFNINATFDALMANKKCALLEELPSHVEYVDAGHIGIVFNHTTYTRILQFLLK
ncbi:unnamed protein product [Adineta steineri]|uniref:Uncharacterized protein n=1 Tax=Adineta steineri TaxID=433720 RepID=A0A819FBP6_9BILA|nr:unnamed protein product [Adineta steineri]CAF3865710.1 unnamed protein product [Adineta steineri]